jgi:hypothetical protein
MSVNRFLVPVVVRDQQRRTVGDLKGRQRSFGWGPCRLQYCCRGFNFRKTISGWTRDRTKLRDAMASNLSDRVNQDEAKALEF